MTLIIAHRLPTIRHVDYVVFLENGEVREAGTSGQLLEGEGRFKDFRRMQELKEFVS